MSSFDSDILLGLTYGLHLHPYILKALKSMYDYFCWFQQNSTNWNVIGLQELQEQW